MVEAPPSEGRLVLPRQPVSRAASRRRRSADSPWETTHVAEALVQRTSLADHMMKEQPPTVCLT